MSEQTPTLEVPTPEVSVQQLIDRRQCRGCGVSLPRTGLGRVYCGMPCARNHLKRVYSENREDAKRKHRFRAARRKSEMEEYERSFKP
jgi:hypothetical protein